MSDLPETEPEIVARLNEDHRRLARVLDVFEHQYRAFETDEGPDYELLRDILDYVQSFPDTVHHPIEDVLFDHLLTSSSLSDDEQQVISENRAQHGRIIDSTKALIQMIDQIFGGGVVDGDSLKLAMSEYLSEQHRHMQFESRYLFPLAQARLSQKDWDTLAEPLKQTQDPLFDARAEQFEILRQHIESLHEPTDH